MWQRPFHFKRPLRSSNYVSKTHKSSRWTLLSTWERACRKHNFVKEWRPPLPSYVSSALLCLFNEGNRILRILLMLLQLSRATTLRLINSFVLLLLIERTAASRRQLLYFYSYRPNEAYSLPRWVERKR